MENIAEIRRARTMDCLFFTVRALIRPLEKPRGATLDINANRAKRLSRLASQPGGTSRQMILDPSLKAW